jgi:hypothetical protein
MAAKDTINRSLVDSFIPEKVATTAIEVLTSYMNLARTVYRDFENETRSEGDTVKVPVYGSISANEMSQTGEVTLQNPADDEVSITLDQHWESSFLIRDVARAMSNQNVLTGYVRASAIALAEKIENSLASLYESVGDTVSAGASLGLDDIQALRKKHVDLNIPRLAPKYLYVGTEGYSDLLGLTTFEDASQFGSRSALIEGKIPMLYGYGIFESQNVISSGSPATYHCLGYTEEAMALVMRPLPNPGTGLGVTSTVVTDPESGVGMRVSYSWDKDHLGIQTTLDVLFGVGTLRDDFLIDVQHT